MAHSENGQESIEAEAAKWVIWLGGEHQEEADQRALARWLSCDPRHQEAFDFARRTWDDLGELQQIVPLKGRKPQFEHRAAAIPVCPPRSRARVWPGVALAAGLVFAVGMSFFWFGNPLLSLAADYRTAPGQQLTVTLADGTVADLGSGSALAVHFDGNERRVELLSGMAYFTAAPKAGAETRPFIVESGIGRARALGTQFAVDRMGEAVEVTVAEHQVDVSVAGPSNPDQHAVLSPGQAVRYSAETGLGVVEEKDLDQAIAWRRGKLIFNDVPLSRVIAELNRYRRGRIVISRVSLARLKVSGIFDTRDLGSALDRIAAELNIGTVSVPPLVTVLY